MKISPEQGPRNGPIRNYSRPDLFTAASAQARRGRSPGMVVYLRVRLGDGDCDIKTFKGRDAWALSELIAAGQAGVTPITHPGPRWSGYVRKLRVAGINIETIHEMHGGAYSGRHARYVMRSAVEIVDVREAA